jgi:hypothetical protein
MPVSAWRNAYDIMLTPTVVTFRYAWHTLPSRPKMRSCILAVASAVVFLVSVTGAGEISAARPGESVLAKLAFTLDKDGGYAFDTGILRGQLLQAGKTLGLSSVVHIPSGARLDGAFGIASYYRVFTRNHRYGTAAWDWPSKSKLLPNGAVQITWLEGEDRPFQMVAVYRWKDSTTLDLETIVKPGKDLSSFEVFLASYFQKVFVSPCVYIAANPEAQSKPGLLLARKSFGDWQMFPRNQEVLPAVQDGRWQKEPNPVKWVIMPCMAAPICLRRGAATDLVAVLMAPPDDCFAIATPYEGESHYSLYLSLFGRDIKAGQTAKARSRFVVTTGVSDHQILELYHNYMKDPANRLFSKE